MTFVGIASLALPFSAQAGGVHVSIGVGVPVVVAPAPVIVQPAPVVIQQPVIVQRAPVIVAEPPVIVAEPRVVYGYPPTGAIIAPETPSPPRGLGHLQRMVGTERIGAAMASRGASLSGLP